VNVRQPSIALIGGGIGGLTAAAALRTFGLDVTVYEQAQAFGHIGAGIQLTANAVKALRGIGIEDHLRRNSFATALAYNRQWNTGKVTNILVMGKELETRYGAPDLFMHRATLHSALAATVPAGCVRFDKRLVGIDRSSNGFTLSFLDGTRADADTVIGADGIHSVVRDILLSAERPRYTGRVAYRTTYPSALLDGTTVDDRAKWWGPNQHIVHYFISPQRDEIYFIAVTPEPDFEVESWSTKGDVAALCAAFEDFHPTARKIVACASDVRKWALVERDPLPRWSEGRITLLGDACHPMPPFMAQGAASAIEDAVVLARCLDGVPLEGFEAAVRQYERLRKERTAQMQLINRQNTWLRFKTDTDWVYAYDAWHEPLSGHAAEAVAERQPAK
jgi:salicylate hydroxylase/6-hydroxynicotinate 3-monooxygenase